MCCAGVVYRRCVLYYADTRYLLSFVADPGLADESLSGVVADIAERRRSCEKCVCSFASVWVDRLTNEKTKRRAVGAMQSFVATTYAMSTVVERKHLLGQEQAKTRSRGKRLRAEELSLRSYVESVRVAIKTKTSGVTTRATRGIHHGGKAFRQIAGWLCN